MYIFFYNSLPLAVVVEWVPCEVEYKEFLGRACTVQWKQLAGNA